MIYLYKYKIFEKNEHQLNCHALLIAFAINYFTSPLGGEQRSSRPSFSFFSWRSDPIWTNPSSISSNFLTFSIFLSSAIPYPPLSRAVDWIKNVLNCNRQWFVLGSVVFDMNLSLSSSSPSSVPPVSVSSSSSSSSPSYSSSSSSTTSWLSGIVRGRADRSASMKMSANTSSGSPVGDSPGPVVKKNHFRGFLFKYGPKPIQVRGSFIFHITLSGDCNLTVFLFFAPI